MVSIVSLIACVLKTITHQVVKDHGDKVRLVSQLGNHRGSVIASLDAAGLLLLQGDLRLELELLEAHCAVGEGLEEEHALRVITVIGARVDDGSDGLHWPGGLWLGLSAAVAVSATARRHDVDAGMKDKWVVIVVIGGVCLDESEEKLCCDDLDSVNEVGSMAFYTSQSAMLESEPWRSNLQLDTMRAP
jgi:hypothetical protein